MAAPSPLVRLLTPLFGRLKYPWLFVILAGLFLLDLVTPDLIPFADELLLGLLTFMVGSWKERRPDEPAAPATRTPTAPAAEALAACDACGVMRPEARLRATPDGRRVCADGCRATTDR